jgi:hypothetical protein
LKRLDLDEDLLRHLIEDEKLTQRAVANHIGVHVATIERRCRQLGLSTQRTGPRAGHLHTGWKGGRRIVKGYVHLYCPDHPHTTKKGYVAEHRLVMEQTLGRHLLPTEVVHHLNNDPQDNRPENLEVFPDNATHLRATRSGQTPVWTAEGKARIQTGLTKRANQLRQGIGAPPRSQQTGRFQAKPGKPSPEAS